MIGLAALAMVVAQHCAAEDAHYVLRHNPGVTAYFRKVDSGQDWPSGLALAIHVKAGDATSWWLPWAGGTDGLQHLASTVDVMARDWRPPNPDGGPRPYGDREYVGTDDKYNVIGEIPHRGQPAPAHMLIPNAGGSGDKVFLTKQFFDLASCSAHGK